MLLAHELALFSATYGRFYHANGTVLAGFMIKACLTLQQKKENRSISRARIAVEHLIGDLKAFHILSDRFRNRIDKAADQVILVVAGLCNLKNDYAVQ